MSSTFDTIANIIAETCDIPRESITPESHAINDLGIDSLDFLDIAFAIDKAFGIKLPLEQWTQEVFFLWSSRLAIASAAAPGVAALRPN